MYPRDFAALVGIAAGVVLCVSVAFAQKWAICITMFCGCGSIFVFVQGTDKSSPEPPIVRSTLEDAPVLSTSTTKTGLKEGAFEADTSEDKAPEEDRVTFENARLKSTAPAADTATARGHDHPDHPDHPTVAMGTAAPTSPSPVAEWIEPESTICRTQKHLRCLVNGWQEPQAKSFRVRSRRYLSTRVKQPSIAPPMFGAIGMQGYLLGEGKEPLYHSALTVPSLREHIQARPDGCFFVVGWILPGPPTRTVVFAWQRQIPVGVDPLADRLIAEFLDGTDEQRTSRLKYLPRLEMVPAMVQRGMKMIGGERPTMLSKKIQSRYFRGPNYIEVNIDITTSAFARMVTGIIVPKIKEVCVSHAFVLEGHKEEELPERILAAVTNQGVDVMGNIVRVPEDKVARNAAHGCVQGCGTAI